MVIRIQALARLKALGAPVSVGEQRRFRDQFFKLYPFMRKGIKGADPNKLTFRENDTTRVLDILAEAGWVKSEHRGSGNAYIYERHGRWPIAVLSIQGQLHLRLPVNDKYGEDPLFHKTFADQAHKILGDGARLLNGVWSWYGQGERGTTRIAEITARAAKAGFKSRTPTVARNQTELRHPQGLVLGLRTGANGSAADLSFDAERG